MAFKKGRAHRKCSRVGVCTAASLVVLKVVRRAAPGRNRSTTGIIPLDWYISLIITDPTKVWIPIRRVCDIFLHRLAIELTPSKNRQIVLTVCGGSSRGGVGGAGGARFADGFIIVNGITWH